MKRLFYTAILLFIGITANAQYGTITFNQDTVIVMRRLKLLNVQIGAATDSLITHKANSNIGKLHMNQLIVPYANITGAPSFIKSFNQVTRPVNSTAFTPSTTKDAELYYSINIACTATIGSTASGKVALQYSVNGGSTWIDVAEVSNSNTVTLAIALNSVSSQTCVLNGQVPANSSVRMVSTIVGTTTITYIRGQEVY